MCFQWKTLKNSIYHIGKESNELEQSEIFGVSKTDTMEYVNHQKKIRGSIASLTLEKALKIGLDRREFYRLKKKLGSDKPIMLRKKTLDKLLDRTLYSSRGNFESFYNFTSVKK